MECHDSPLLCLASQEQIKNIAKQIIRFDEVGTHEYFSLLCWGPLPLNLASYGTSRNSEVNQLRNLTLGEELIQSEYLDRPSINTIQ